MYDKSIYANIMFPRWDDLPDIELYMDQVVSILEKNLSVFSNGEKLITPSMINNYVKQKIVKPPVKKRYDKMHLAYLFVVCILKQIMPIAQIRKSIEYMLKTYSVPEIYDMFCTELENSLAELFGQAKQKREKTKITPELKLIKCAAASYANLVYANYIVDAE